MKFRTQTVPNGKRDHRDFMVGWDLIFGALGIAALVVAAWVSINREVAANAMRTQSIVDSIPDRIKAEIAANDKTANYLTRVEFDDYKTQRAEVVETALASIYRELSHISSGQIHNRSILEKLPKTTEGHQ